jgi:ABC-2 type transport system permease protein
VIVAVALRVGAADGAGPGRGPAFLSQVTGNGFFVALVALAAELVLFLPIAVAMLAGDAVAGEAHQGTLRYLLAVPVERTRLLAVKYAGIVAGAFLAPLVVAATGLVAGLAVFGGGDVPLLSGSRTGMGAALLRLLGVCLYLGVCLAALGAIGLFLSTLTEQPMAATIALTMLTVASSVLLQIPQLDWLHPFLFTDQWLAFGDLLRDPVPTGALVDGLVLQVCRTAVALAIAWSRFTTRDITS